MHKELSVFVHVHVNFTEKGYTNRTQQILGKVNKPVRNYDTLPVQHGLIVFSYFRNYLSNVCIFDGYSFKNTFLNLLLIYS